MKLLAALVLVASCSSSKPAERDKGKPDCDAYAEKIGAVMGAGLEESRRHSLVTGAKQACDNGRLTKEQAACVEGANTEEQIRGCMGLGATVHAPTTPPPPQAAKTHVKLVRLGDQATLPVDQRTWFEALQSNVAVACDVPALVPPASFTVTVHYAERLPKTVDAAAAPEPLRACLTKAFSVPAERPASIWIEALPFAVDVTN